LERYIAFVFDTITIAVFFLNRKQNGTGSNDRHYSSGSQRAQGCRASECPAHEFRPADAIVQLYRTDCGDRWRNLPEAVLSPLSPASWFVTGTVVPIDGGFSAYSGVWKAMKLTRTMIEKDGVEAVAGASVEAPAAGHSRWIICALLFFAATVNYIDRQVIGLLKPTLQAELHWSEIDYSNIVFAFQLAYAAGLLVVGRVMDWLGTRRGFSLAVFIWSVAAMAHALARSVPGFSAARFALGLGESGSFPASIKTVAEWFPRRERALATGLFNSGTNVGAIVTPLAVPWLTHTYGWQGAFVATGAFGFLWLVFWVAFYQHPDKHPSVTAAELAYIRSDPPESITPIRWSRVIGHRQMWAFAIGKFLTDPVWWLYLFWIPDFLNRNYRLDLLGMILPLLIIYNAATVGSICGGWLSSSLIQRGWSINASRKTAMLVCALAVVPIVFAARTPHLYLAVALVSLAAAAHQGWSANIFTLTSDMFPRRAIGSVVGFGGMAGAVGGMLIAKVVGYVLQWTGSYFSVFIIAGSTYLVALGIIHLLAPKLEPASVEAE
jgi:ACS family hexuronate transporter-like MFS transporter